MNCPECPEPTVLVDDVQTGDTICTACGLVLQSGAFETPAFHEGAPLEPVLATQTICRPPRHLMHAAGDSSKLRGIVGTSCDLRASAARISLPAPVVDHAATLLEAALSSRVCKGELRQGLVAACLYYACKVLGYPRTKKAVAVACVLPVDVVAKGLKLYTTMNRDACIVLAKPTESRDVLSCLVARATLLIPTALQRKVQAQARLVDEAAMRTGVLEGKTPHVRGGAALCIAMQRMGLPCKELHGEIGVSHNTLTYAVGLIRQHT